MWVYLKQQPTNKENFIKGERLWEQKKLKMKN